MSTILKFISLIIILLLVTVSCSLKEDLFISLEENICITYEKLNHSTINGPINSYTPKYAQLEVLIENTTDEKVKIISIKNLMEKAIFLNSSFADNPEFFSDEFKECRKQKGYNILIKEYESEYSITLVIDSEKKLLPKEQFKMKMKFEKQGIYKIITQSYNKKPGEKALWGLHRIGQHQSELFEIK
ncbi:hypothetical protein [Kordia sp.]|uniref:hypothetical protein n=1 Tax=Kordia sp. TaxID=1965332 RepID=UPI003D6A1BD5